VVALRLIKSKITEEKGYLLLESLVTLSMILAIILILYPLIVDWLVLRETEKENVEHARILYEASMQWPEQLPGRGVENYAVYVSDSSLTISKNNKTIGVDIYEVKFD
jgi:hypothetical protein